MPKLYSIPLWKLAPFLRLLIPLILGIIFQWYAPTSFSFIISFSIFFITSLFIFYVIPLSYRYQYQWVQGVLLNVILFLFGAFLCFNNDVRNQQNWYGNTYTDSSTIIIKIIEPLIEKEKSYKTIGVVESVMINDKRIATNGKVLIYFAKSDSGSLPTYGSYIATKASLQKIKNAGNPGGFDYSRYMIYQQTTHQIYIKTNAYQLLKTTNKNALYHFIFTTKASIIGALQKYIIGSKKITGIAEALLIGYKEDLDKDVVQAYSNTGVVHIIAISGMHLGLIYIGLVWLISRIPFVKNIPIARVIIILSCLWLFSLLTGASASVLRSAVMFTCIIIGKEFFKQASIYNSLATSAFLLLCYNPFLIWDVGFQLSYFAIVGIIWLQKPIENLYYTKNIILQYIWKMCSITLAAQILTLPICIYYFHQIPTTFLITNLICVPLSSLILFAEIALILFSFYPPLASILGKFTYVLTWCMNTFINFFNELPFSLIDKIYATPITTWALYGFVFFLAAALLRKNKMILNLSITFLAIYLAIFLFGKITLTQQKKVIIYHVSKHTAIDFLSKNKYWFYGDEAFVKEGTLQNFNLKPSRVLAQVEKSIDTLPSLQQQGQLWQFYHKKIIIIDKTIEWQPLQNKILVDVLLICKNPTIKFDNIISAITPTIIVFDGSNSMWKIKQWKKQCEDLHLQYFDTNEQGAFILNAH